MKKSYQAPEAELILLMSKESIADTSVGDASSEYEGIPE